MLALMLSCISSSRTCQASTSTTSTSNTNFAELINHYAEGRPARTPWVGYWWPYTLDGIARAETDDTLSPIAKYEKASGKIGAEEWERKYHGRKVPRVQNWWGHTNGWAAASVLFSEPTKLARLN